MYLFSNAGNCIKAYICKEYSGRTSQYPIKPKGKNSVKAKETSLR